MQPLADAPQRGVERRLDDQLVVELQLADDALDAIERRLILQDRDDAFAIGLLARKRGMTLTATAALPALILSSLVSCRHRRRRVRRALAIGEAELAAAAARPCRCR